MSRRVIIASLTYSNQANRDAALASTNTALSGYVYADIATALPAGINTPSANVLTISIEIDDRDTAFGAAEAIYSAITSNKNTRQTVGYMSVNRI